LWYGIDVPEWGFLTSHARVLLHIARDPGARLRDIAAALFAHTTRTSRLHRARIAHRSLHGSNIMIGPDGCPRLADFSFAELAATSRQRAIDVAELLTSLAGRIGPDRAVAAAAAVIGGGGVAAAVPLLQPLALSAGTRRAIKGQDGLLKNTRAAAIAACGGDADHDLVRLQRVRPRTLLAIAALAGAFYFLLPQIAQVSSSWHALQHVNWAWLPVILGLSALTYLASAVALLGAVPGRVPFGPAVLAQGASSFINRVSPANVGGMALNARFLQKTGTGTPASVAAVGVNALAGAIMHLVLIVVFFALAGHDLTQAFKLPSGSKILLALAVIIAVIGVVLATRPGRRWTRKQLIPGVRSAAGSLRQAAASPVKLGLLVGGSALITLACIAGLAGSVQAFGRGPGLVVIGAVYLAAAALAAAAPTPGGLGAIEAALVAGLTGVGMQPGPAVSAVLLYRLATYWLPVLPGWLCWRSLQHREYV
jgi:glycosyltransferase 2 family protein